MEIFDAIFTSFLTLFSLDATLIHAVILLVRLTDLMSTNSYHIKSEIPMI